MAVAYTFSPPYHPDWGLQRQFKPLVLRAAFGDGYSQRTADGINSLPVTFSARWTNLVAADKDTILNFFIARKGYQSFYYQYVDESSPKVYICGDWSYTHDDAGAYGISANFMQVYDI